MVCIWNPLSNLLPITNWERFNISSIACDNQSCIVITKKCELNHVKVQYHFSKDLILSKKVSEYCEMYIRDQNQPT